MPIFSASNGQILLVAAIDRPCPEDDVLGLQDPLQKKSGEIKLAKPTNFVHKRWKKFAAFGRAKFALNFLPTDHSGVGPVLNQKC